MQRARDERVDVGVLGRGVQRLVTAGVGVGLRAGVIGQRVAVVDALVLVGDRERLHRVRQAEAVRAVAGDQRRLVAVLVRLGAVVDGGAEGEVLLLVDPF